MANLQSLRTFRKNGAVNAVIETPRGSAIKLSYDPGDERLKSKVIFTGVRADIESVFAAMDLFVSTSLYEAMPTVIIEAMAAYQQRTGLKPAGPHRTMADELLGPLFRVCDVCGGKELLTIAGGSDWKDCPACAGNCCVPTASKAAWEEARRQVLCIFPDADVKWNA